MKNISDRTSQKANKQRLDILLVEQGMAESREKAKRLIMAGEVTVDGVKVDKAGKTIPADAHIEVAEKLPYVSRGGVKLAAALDTFAVEVEDRMAIDVGASTGGFTDCLLQHGVVHVYAVDVGYGQIAWKLRTDPRVTVIERTNIRYLEQLPDGAFPEVAVVDASFISLDIVLPSTLNLLASSADIIALIKPQFEAGREQVGKGGVVREQRVHRHVLRKIWKLAESLDLIVCGLCVSPLLGPAGNAEFLIWLQRNSTNNAIMECVIDDVLADAKALRQRC